ncbi:MAG TPA: transglutaminase-like domain-containing protein [Candidatus Coprenecus stercoravium]|uniref:Transglutaminase-like domain-containing protein n=1 Tax=Candidatus Coprenecus stercoravium TaxID=2840735 RepID=A0A9D2GPY9_9BACT|nr:transglutaminase-like domain-containing protein [Candidatus Coprenecus stercoravium]
MTGQDVDTVELDSMLELLSDKDEFTLDMVRERVFKLGWRAVEYFYQNMDKVERPYGRTVYRNVCEISSVLAFKEILDLLKSGEAFYVPDGLYSLTRILRPELAPDTFRLCYEDAGNSLICGMNDSMTAVEKVEMLNYVVYDKYGFRLDGGMNTDETTVLLPDLMEKRRGGVVGLSTVYFMLASYAGLPVYPLFPKSPGYFVAYFDGTDSLFTIDVGNYGRISEPVPKEDWKKTPFMGTDRTILYIYAASLRRFGLSDTFSDRLACMLLNKLLDVLAV